MNLIVGRDAEIAAWVAARIPHVDDFGLCTTIGVATDKLIAGFVYSEFQPQALTIQMSGAATSPIWAKREIIHELFRYPFEQLGVFKVWTATPHDNEKALKVNKHIGLKQEAVLAHHFGPKRHAVINRMTEPDYRRIFYGETHGQKFAKSA